MQSQVELAQHNLKGLEDKEHELQTLYAVTKDTVNAWSEAWVNFKLGWLSQEEYNKKLDNLNDDFEKIASIQRTLIQIRDRNNDTINSVNHDITITRDENRQLKKRLNSFKGNEISAKKQLKIDNKMFEETMFMNLLYFFSIMSMIIITLQKVYGK